MKKSPTISENERRYLTKILKMDFIKNAITETVFKKLFLDGYVNCNSGLFPQDKELLKRKLKNDNSPLYAPLEEINANSASYSKIYKLLLLVPQINELLSTVEIQALLYILMLPVLKEQYSFVFMIALGLQYPQNSTEYHQYGSFIKCKNINLRPIDTLEKYIVEITKMGVASNTFSRGHTNINYLAIPSLYREKRLYKNEYVMYQELVIRCPQSFVNCTSHLDFLIEMQHYGLPTRLLDVTANPLISLYFACEKGDTTGEVIFYSVKNSALKYEKCDEVAILSSLPMFTYAQQKDILNGVTKGDYLINEAYQQYIMEIRSERVAFKRNISLNEITCPVFVKPSRRNQRISHQEGAFLIWGLDPKTYDIEKDVQATSQEATFRLKQDEQQTVFYIEPNKKTGIIETLNRIGINKAYVYPEIDDVAEYIKKGIKE